MTIVHGEEVYQFPRPPTNELNSVRSREVGVNDERSGWGIAKQSSRISIDDNNVVEFDELQDLLKISSQLSLVTADKHEGTECKWTPDRPQSQTRSMSVDITTGRLVQGC